MKLTKSIIDRTQYEGAKGARFVIWDKTPSGFGLRIYPSGRKAFILSYRFQGRKHLLTIGDYGELTLDQARERALRANLNVKDGEDPLLRRRKEVAGETIGELCDEYIERYAKPHKKTWAEDQRRLNRFIRPAWRVHKIRSISSEDVSTLHRKIGKDAPYEANRVLELLAKMFGLAKEWKMLDITDPNPARRIKSYKETKRDRWVKPIELTRLTAAISAESNIYIRAAIWLYLFTGVRKSELLKAKWEDVDLHEGELSLPDTKSGRPHRVPLSAPAIALLKMIPRQINNDHIIPGQILGKHLVNIAKPWDRIRKRAEIEDVRIHDLRRTVGSMMAQDGNSLNLIGEVLNHSSVATTKIYARFGQNHVREALEEHGKRLIEIVSPGSSISIENYA